MAEGLLTRISEFSSVKPKCEPSLRYYKHVLEILSLLKPVIDEIVASEISLDGNLEDIFEKLGGHIKYARELMEGWHKLSSRLYFALHFEYMIAKVHACTTEMLQLLCQAFKSLPEDSLSACVESCQQKIGKLDYEPLSEYLKQAIADQTRSPEMDAGLVGKITESLNLSCNEDLLIEAVALDKLKTKLSQVESPEEDMEYVDPLISLVNQLHESYVRAHQLPNINSVQIPADFCCPLSLELMSDPVIVASGQTYERVFIRKWLDHGLTVCPKTRQPLGHSNLIPNYTVKALIANWCESNNIKLPDPTKSVSLNQPSLFPADGDTNLEDSCIPRFSYPKNLISAMIVANDHRTNGSSSTTEEASSSLGQLSIQPKKQGQDRGQGTSDDVAGEAAVEEAAPSSAAVDGEGQQQRSSGQDNICRRPSDRHVPRIVPSSAVDAQAEPSEIEAEVHGLIENLSSESIELRRSAARELRMMAKENVENRIVIASCGAIPPLVRLLGYDDEVTQENAVTALLNLSINDNNKIAITAANAIEPLIRVLRVGSAEAKENSAATLFSLSVIEENKAKIGRAGAIEPLVELLRGGTSRGKKDAATALFNLSIFHENKARIVEAGAVGHLVELMDPATGMVDKAVAVLANLATIHEGRVAIGEGGGLQGLVEVVEVGSARGKENAVAALLNICTNSSRFCTMVLQEGAVPPLVALSQLGTPRAKEKAQLLLTHFRNQRHGGGRS